MSTQEIDKAIAALETDTLKDSLKVLGEEVSGDQTALRKRYQESVLTVGLKSFINKLKSQTVSSTCKALGVSEDKGKDGLVVVALEKGINGLVDVADEDLLKKFCETLGLESAEKSDMKKQIADEVMLTGMESLLNRLTKPLLKAHATQMEVSSGGKKKELVERLMVHIFELEPLEEAEPKKPKKEKKEKKKDKKELKEKKEPKEKKPKEPKEKKEPAKREKFVAPPLETICKGKYETYTALYDNFNLPDLQKYCKLQNLKTSGKKKEVINRIIHYLNTGETEQPKKQKRKKGKKAEEKGEGKAAKKQKTEGAGEGEEK